MYHAVRKKKITLDLRNNLLACKEEKTIALDCEWGSRPAKGSFLFYRVTNPLRNNRHTQWLPWNHSCLDCQILSGWPPPKKTKVATRPTMAAVSHSRFLQFLTRFHKKSTHRNLLRTLMNKTQENHPQKAQPEHTVTDGIVFQNLRKTGLHFTKLIPQGY